MGLGLEPRSALGRWQNRECWFCFWKNRTGWGVVSFEERSLFVLIPHPTAEPRVQLLSQKGVGRNDGGPGFERGGMMRWVGVQLSFRPVGITLAKGAQADIASMQIATLLKFSVPGSSRCDVFLVKVELCLHGLVPYL